MLDPSISMQLDSHMKNKQVHIYSCIFTFTCIVYDKDANLLSDANWKQDCKYILI